MGQVVNYGKAKPAFTCHRFKRAIVIVANEEFGEALYGVLVKNEKELSSRGKHIPVHLYEFTNQLLAALDQPPPALGEKPCPPPYK